MAVLYLIVLTSIVSLSTGYTECGGKPAEIFFLVDSSSSIWLKDYEIQRQFVANVVDNFDISPNKTRVGAAVFASGYQPLISFSQNMDKEALKAAIKRMPYLTGDTYTGRAIFYMRTRGFDPQTVRKDVVRIGIILTDGVSRFTDRTRREAQIAKDNGIFLFAVGIGDKTDVTELAAIGSDPKENFVFQVAGFDVLTKIREKLAWKACEVEVPQGDQPACGRKTKADIIFVYDSGNLGSRSVTKINDFIVEMIPNFNMATGNIRSGVVSTNCYRGDISLQKHTDKNAFISDLEKKKVPNFSFLARRLRLHTYGSLNGGRDDVQKIAILFLDSALIEPKAVMSEIRRAKFSRITIFVVAIGTDYNMAEVNAIATTTDHVIKLETYEELADKRRIEDCVNRICLDLTDVDEAQVEQLKVKTFG